MIKKSALLLLLGTSILLSACDESPSSPNNNATEIDHVYTYLPQASLSSPHDPAKCINYRNNCTVGELPFIAMSYPDVQIADVMTRVVVSHDWMGTRFETLLAVLPPEVLTLLGSVTAIVIADNIRPSFYWTGSGAIYLDPANLWLTNAEKQTIDQTPDSRSAFSNDLQYDFFHRFIKDDQVAYQYHALTGDEERTIDDIIVPMASLLFHELAHASDFMPVTLMSQLDLNAPIWSEINRFSSQQLSAQLQRLNPINDATLKAHATVLYSGREITESQKLDSAWDLGLLMDQEGANHLYSYSHQAEDVAMLFQASMLNYFYDIQMDSTFVITSDQPVQNCTDYVIAWGQRNRIADVKSKPRARFVSETILPEIDFTAFFNQLDEAQYFPPLIDWCNISLTPSPQATTETRGLHKSPRPKMQKDHHHGVITAFQ